MYTIFETFVGAGGAHIGFKQEGFISKYVNDINDKCIETLLYNNPEIRETLVRYLKKQVCLKVKQMCSLVE